MLNDQFASDRAVAPSPVCLPRVLLQEILAFGPLDGARFMFTGRGGLVAIREGFGSDSEIFVSSFLFPGSN